MLMKELLNYDIPFPTSQKLQTHTNAHTDTGAHTDTEAHTKYM